MSLPCARGKNLRVQPRKISRAAQRIRGLPVGKAILALQARQDRASRVLLELVRAAVANAEHNLEIPAGGLVVARVEVGRGVAMRRFRPQPRGMAHPIRKGTANVEVMLEGVA
ncbi:50S ribosomal protein L22 [bacterium]|nr:50S ribosomal protein L22 [bacterium]